jgi:hypothetical protein
LKNYNSNVSLIDDVHVVVSALACAGIIFDGNSDLTIYNAPSGLQAVTIIYNGGDNSNIYLFLSCSLMSEENKHQYLIAHIFEQLRLTSTINTSIYGRLQPHFTTFNFGLYSKLER